MGHETIPGQRRTGVRQPTAEAAAAPEHARRAHLIRAGTRALCLGAAAGLLVALCGGRGWAQATSGSFLVKVMDPSGAALPGTTVTVTSERKGPARDAATDDSGEAAIANLPPDVYGVSVSLSGFKTARRSGLALVVDQKLSLAFTLALGDLAEVVDVPGSTPMLQTQSAETGEVIEQRQIQDLPLLGRDFLELTRLTAGTTSGEGGNNVNLSVNGQREFGNSVMIDGVEVTGNRNNDTGLRPSIDAVQEFKVVTSAYAPEFGRAAGAVVTIQTRSGSNALHGSLSEFYRPTSTTARSFFATDRPRLDQHNFGGTLGGPLRRDRTFFFGAYEGVRLKDGFSYLDSVPPADQIRFLPNGDVDLSNLRDPNTGAMVPVFDPAFFATNFFPQQFPGHVIPADRVSPAGRAILQQLFPQPNAPGLSNGWFNNYAVNQDYRYDSDTASARVDHTLRDADRLSLVHHFATFDSSLGDRFAGAIPIAGGGGGDGGDRTASTSHSVSLAWTRVFERGWVAETRVGYNDFNLRQESLTQGRGLAAQLGLGNITLPGSEQTDGLPNIALGSGPSTGGSTYKPLRFRDRNLQVTSSLTGRAGRHDLKAGVDVRRLTAQPDFTLFPTGFLYFGGPYASLTSDPLFGTFDPAAYYATGGSDVADLLLGLPLSANMGLQLTQPETRSWEAHAFAQDSWRATERLTLMYGVRYEYQAPFMARDGQASNFDPVTLRLLLADRGGNSSSLVAPDRNNFAPRVGAAWQVTPHTVLRGGWGLFYTPENDARSDVLTKNYPFAVRQDFANSPYEGLPFLYRLDEGVPRQGTLILPSGDSLGIDEVPNARNQAFFVLDPAFHTGYAQLFNVVVERELTPGVTAEVGYVGSIGRDLPYAIGNLNRNDRLSDAIGSVGGQFAVGDSAFHSLQTKLTRRLSNGLSLLAVYTFGKSLDNGPAPFNLGRNSQEPQDPFDLDREWGPSVYDVRHNLVGSFIYELPFWRSAQGVRALLGGWQANGILTMRSGRPLNVVRNGSNQAAPGLRPDLVGDPELSRGDRSLTRYFDFTAFTAAGLGPTEPGDAGRNILRGPGFVNLDFSLFKGVRLNETLSAQIRVEAFNLTNTPHFANPNNDLSRGDFGTITQTVGNSRILQFAARLTF